MVEQPKLTQDDDIRDEKGPSTILISQEGEPPHIAKTYVCDLIQSITFIRHRPPSEFLPTENPIQERRNSALDPQCSLSSVFFSASLLFAFSFWCLRLSIGQLSSILWKSPLLAARSAIADLVWMRTSSDIYTSCDHFQHSRPNFNVHVLLDRSLSIFLLIQWVSLHCCGWMQTELIFLVICQHMCIC